MVAASLLPGKRDALAKVFDLAGLNRVINVGASRSHVLVLNYHRIGDPDSTLFDRDILSATPEEFANQIDFLSAQFDIVGLKDAIAITRGDCVSSKPAVAITFDDGYADNALIATPILAERGLSATFFLTTGFLDHQQLAWWDRLAWTVKNATVDGVMLPEFNLNLSFRGSARRRSIRKAIEAFKTLPTDMAKRMLQALAASAGAGPCPDDVRKKIWMSWDDAREMVRQGMVLGGHTVNHPVLSRLDVSDQREEIFGCRDRIASETGVQPTHFSYPVGQPDSFTPATQSLVREAGFETAFSFYGGVWSAGHENMTDIPRVAVERNHRGALFRSRIAWPRMFAS